MAITQFPVKTALALATTIAALGVYHHFDKGKGLSPAIFPEAAHLALIRHDPSLTPATNHPLNGIQQPQSTPKTTTSTPNPCAPSPPGLLPNLGAPSLAASSADKPKPAIPRSPISANLIDPCGNLDPFFAALHTLELQKNVSSVGQGSAPGEAGGPASPSAHSPSPQILTVLHYGDSPTTADLITGDVRDLLQQRFGDAGRGFLLTAKPWAWYGHRGIDLSDKGWDIATAVGKGREAVYGLGGAAFEGGPEASTHITLKDPTGSAATMELAYLAQPNGGSLSISANGVPIRTLSTADPEGKSRPAWHTVSLPPATKAVDLKPTAGVVKLFGESFLTGQPGVIYDSLGLNGASTSVLSNGFNAAAWGAELQHTRPTLVIINYGTNESGFGAYVDKQYEPTLRTAITRVRAALPGVPILVMSPMDRGRRTGVDQIETFDTIPRILAIQRRVATEQNCAFFDTFNAMGGDGTMSRWYTGHPRLVAADLIHPTPQGASLVAHLFVKDLALGYDRFLGHIPPIQPVPQRAASTSPNPPPAAAAAPPLPAPAVNLNFAPQSAVTTSPLPRPKPSAAGQPIRPQPEPSPPPQPVAPEPPQA